MGEDVEWIDLVKLTYDRDMWQTHVNTIMTAGYFLTI
jgi:hypothetical protein